MSAMINKEVFNSLPVETQQKYLEDGYIMVDDSFNSIDNNNNNNNMTNSASESESESDLEFDYDADDESCAHPGCNRSPEGDLYGDKDENDKDESDDESDGPGICYVGCGRVFCKKHANEVADGVCSSCKNSDNPKIQKKVEKVLKSISKENEFLESLFTN